MTHVSCGRGKHAATRVFVFSWWGLLHVPPARLVDLEAPFGRRSAQAWLPLWRKRLWAPGLRGGPGAFLPHPALWAWMWNQMGHLGVGREEVQPVVPPQRAGPGLSLLADPALLADWGLTP